MRRDNRVNNPERYNDMNEYFKDFFFRVLLEMGHTNIKKISFDFDNGDYEYGRRLFYTYDNQPYTIRMWNMYENGDIDFTVYKTVGDHGESQISGYYKNMSERIRA